MLLDLRPPVKPDFGALLRIPETTLPQPRSPTNRGEVALMQEWKLLKSKTTMRSV